MIGWNCSPRRRDERSEFRVASDLASLSVTSIGLFARSCPSSASGPFVERPQIRLPRATICTERAANLQASCPAVRASLREVCATVRALSSKTPMKPTKSRLCRTALRRPLEASFGCMDVAAAMGDVGVGVEMRWRAQKAVGRSGTEIVFLDVASGGVAQRGAKRRRGRVSAVGYEPLRSPRRAPGSLRVPSTATLRVVALRGLRGALVHAG